MVVTDFYDVLKSKSLGRVTLPSDDEMFERIFTGLKRLAVDTIPLRLVRTVPKGNLITFSVLRKIEDETYVRTPNKPIIVDDDIDTDAELIDALALFIMAGLERTQAKVYMGMYYKEIDLNNDRLTETALTESSNDCTKQFRQFP